MAELVSARQNHLPRLQDIAGARSMPAVPQAGQSQVRTFSGIVSAILEQVLDLQALGSNDLVLVNELRGELVGGIVALVPLGGCAAIRPGNPSSYPAPHALGSSRYHPGSRCKPRHPHWRCAPG